jgi:DNA-directed RNA polymerase specialized sigma subunit
LTQKASLQDIVDEVDSVFSKETSLAPNAKIYLCQRYKGEKLKDIGGYFGIGESGVSQASRRLKDKLRTDKKIKRKISKIEKNLNL